MDIFVTKQRYPATLSPLQMLAAFLSIHSMLPLFILADVMTQMYQAVYFRIMEIPVIPRSKYVQPKRHKLGGLSRIQKWSCWYCEYVNGVIAWMKEVANQTELYSCAIKYSHEFPGQGYQKDFYDQSEFEEPSASVETA